MEKQKFLSLIDEIIKNNISDLHLGSNEYPYIRNKTGDMAPVEQYGRITDGEMLEIAKMLLEEDFTSNTRDVSFAHGGSRFRVNISRTINGVTIAFRTIPSKIPEPDEILLPASLLEATNTGK